MNPTLIDGPVVVIGPRVAVLLERTLGLNKLRVEVRGRDAELDSVLSAWHSVALQWSPEVSGSVCGTGNDNGAELSASSVPSNLLTTSQVADAVNRDCRTVRKAAARGELRGQRQGRGWVFEPDDVRSWRAAVAGKRGTTDG